MFTQSIAFQILHCLAFFRICCSNMAKGTVLSLFFCTEAECDNWKCSISWNPIQWGVNFGFWLCAERERQKSIWADKQLGLLKMAVPNAQKVTSFIKTGNILKNGQNMSEEGLLIGILYFFLGQEIHVNLKYILQSNFTF